MATRKSNAKVRAVQTSSGTKLVRAGSKAEAKYQAQGASFSNNAGTIDQARAESKARTSTRSANDPLTVSENAGFETPSYIAPPTITSSLLTPSTGINVPNPPVDTTGTKVMSQVSGLATAPPPPEMSEDPLKALISSMEQAPSADKIYAKVERDAQLKQKQQTVNNLQAQLGAITAKAEADKLSLIGQGRGVTEAIIGGQQAQIDREAAIQSLPIAAQLSAAQGDLESAKDQVNTLFQIRLQDAQNKVDHKNKIAELVFNYANDKQKEQIKDRRDREDRAFTMMRDNLSYARDLASTAIENGQPSLAASIMRLDPNSSTYSADLANISGSISSGKSKSAFTSGFIDASTEQSVREDAQQLLYVAQMDPQTAYKNLRTKYAPAEATDEALKSLLGISESPTGTVDTQSELENEIAVLKSLGLKNQQIRQRLRGRYGNNAVDNSSVGSITEQLSAFLFGTARN